MCILAGVAGWALRPEVPVSPGPLEPATLSAPDTLRIASWNIRQLGGRASTDLRLVSKVIIDNKFDIMAVQEVERDGRGLDRLLNALGAPWRSTRLGPESRSGERLAFIYRGDRVAELGPAQELEGASPGVFERVPYTASFRCGHFDFELITAHLSWGDVRQRHDEMKLLSQLVSSLAKTQAEKDLIVLGDFNEQKSRPNLPLMFSVDWFSVITEGTNLSGKEIYDHILLNQNYTREYLHRSGVVNFEEQLFPNQERQAANAVSDHRPVWADFSTTEKDDD